MKKSNKKIKKKMKRVLHEHFEGSHDQMKESFWKLSGYGMNHPKYLDSLLSPDFAWLDMDNVISISDYLDLAYMLINPEPVSTFKVANKE